MSTLPNFIARRPHVAEHDFAGVIVDPNGSHFQKGDEVFGWLPARTCFSCLFVALYPDCHREATTFSTGQGALAQYTRVHPDQLALKPRNIDFINAAGISLVALTAYQGLRLAKVEAGKTVFINGGSSSVGSMAVQMAKAQGCKVVSSCSTPNVELVKRLGADEVTASVSSFFYSDLVCATGN